jgi:low density lipoprotein receptor-related protein 5/6
MRKLTIVLAWLILTVPCPAKTIYVDAGAVGANNGLSWADAYNDLEDAVVAGVTGDEILVAEGGNKPAQVVRVTADDSNSSDDVNFANDVENSEHVAAESGTGAATEMIYWTTVFGTSIKRSSLESPQIELVLSELNVNLGIALDMIDGKVYWTGVQPEGIYRANLNGTNIERIIGGCGQSGLCSHHNIALDLVAGKMYWTESGLYSRFYKLRRANLDGSDVEDVIPTEALRRPKGIALDLAAGKIYWGGGTVSQEDKGRIRRANLDGSAIEDVIEVGRNTVGLELDLGEEKMYWTNNQEGEVWRANLDGTMKELLIAGLDNPLGLALDLTKGKLYCADHHAGKIKRSNLDGTEVEDFLVTRRYRVEGLALTIIPEVVVEAAIEIEPDTLNLKSGGRWITCYIALPEWFDVAYIDIPSVVLEEGIGAEEVWLDEKNQVAIAKFKRSELQDVLDAGEVELTVSGELRGVVKFEGTDVIRVIDKAGGK